MDWFSAFIGLLGGLVVAVVLVKAMSPKIITKDQRGNGDDDADWWKRNGDDD